MYIPFIIQNNTISAVINGRSYTVDETHPRYREIYEAFKSGDHTPDELVDMMDVQAGINHTFQQAGCGKAEVRNGVVYYDGEVINSSLSRRILDLMADGFSVAPFIKFLDNLMDNPSKQSIDELYDFLANTGLPITEDGCFLAYKGLRRDFKDIHSGTFDNSPGRTVEIRRNKVDDDRNRTCSYGLHVGAFEYASSFAGGGPVVLVKVNPRDVVSVPLDCGAQKCRTCKYEVLEQYSSPEELKKSLYGQHGEQLAGRASDSYEACSYDYEAELDDSIDYYLGSFELEELQEQVRQLEDDGLINRVGYPEFDDEMALARILAEMDCA